eukprot:m.480509 g.480509  ORF g.480509 m.480509 type:complete len:339 (-) comp21859_c0_seq1:1361-2377(-)
MRGTMSAAATVVACVLVSVAVSPVQGRAVFDMDTAAVAHAQWEAFKVSHSKMYATDAEEARRFDIFTDNLEYIRQHQAKQGVSYSLGVTAFADLTHSEFAAMMTTLPTQQHQQQQQPRYPHHPTQPLPAEKNYTSTGCVRPAQSQGQCGSAAVFAVLEIVQTVKCLGTEDHHVEVLSEQQIAECLPGGCAGGPLQPLLQYCEQTGFEPEANYPSGHHNHCPHLNASAAVHCKQWHTIPSGNETALTEVLAFKGPAICPVDASSRDFQLYSGGVFDDPKCGQQLDHVMFNVGYGEEDGKKFYLLENSWGSGWGEQGFMRLAREQDNMCGVASGALWLTL